MKVSFAATAQPSAIADEALQEEYSHLSDECQKLGHSSNLLFWMRNRIRTQHLSFAHSERIMSPPLDVLISAKVVSYFLGSVRFFFTLFHSSTRHVLSNYFDKAVFDVGVNHFEWTRDPDSLELDGLEYVVSNAECPIQVSCVLYPDFIVPYYIVPDHLRQITGTSCSFFAHIIKSIVKYAGSKSLLVNKEIICDECLQSGLGVSSISSSDLPVLLHSVLLPVPPITMSFVLQPEAPRYNATISLPDFSQLSPLPVPPNRELDNAVMRFAAQKETCDLFSAIGRNPCEAIEAEIAAHCTECEVQEEREGAGPVGIFDAMNPAKRSTAFYWQAWAADYIPRFLEENKTVHGRYAPKK
jgi:hypothetical protein